MINFRLEQKEDYQTVEEITRKAFWNTYMPGCVEHYLIHTMRSHADFLPDLDLILEEDQKVIGSVVYTKAKLRDRFGRKKTVLTFGPVSILPEYQRKGYGKQLLAHSFQKAEELGYDSIVIFGDPRNFVSSGFKSCVHYNICLEDGSFPAAMLVKELHENAFDGRKWIYHPSSALNIDPHDAEEFDAQFEPMEKKERPEQEVFSILSQSIIRR